MSEEDGCDVPDEEIEVDAWKDLEILQNGCFSGWKIHQLTFEDGSEWIRIDGHCSSESILKPIWIPLSVLSIGIFRFFGTVPQVSGLEV
jgi:hypothetical protein